MSDAGRSEIAAGALLAICVAVGAALAVALHNVAWVGIGCGLGVIVSVLFNAHARGQL